MDGILLWPKISEVAKTAEEAKALAELLTSIGTYLSDWDCTTGLPVSFPHTTPYTYTTGMYYFISKVASGSGSNYIPSGTQYTGSASTTVATDEMGISDLMVFDGSVWIHRKLSELLKGVVRADKSQSFTSAEKTQARQNIDAISLEEYNSSASSYDEGILYYVVD